MKKYLFLLFSIGLIVIGILSGYIGIQKQKKCTVETTSTIINIKEQRKKKRDRWKTYYSPVVEYEVNGQVFQHTADIESTSSSDYDVGETLLIKYDPNDPGSFIVSGFSNIWSIISSIGMIIAGIVCLVVFTIGFKKSEEPGVPTETTESAGSTDNQI